MKNLLNNYIRSINIHKITDGEYIDIYVEQFKFLNKLFEDLEYVEGFNSIIYYKNNNGKLILEYDIRWGNNYILERTYKIITTKFGLSIDNYIINYFIADKFPPLKGVGLHTLRKIIDFY